MRDIVARELIDSDLPADLHPVLARVYRGRGVRTRAELELDLSRLAPYSRLRGIEAATDLLCELFRTGGRILVVGDFDADGATSTALALRALRAMGAADVRYLVPNRFEYGYGLTPEIVALAQSYEPDLIITVDNGVSSIRGVEAANAAGIRVLVTDHHLPGPTLPAAAAMVNPNQPGDEFPSKALAGVGVVFYVMAALRARLREIGWFEAQRMDPPNLAQWLDLVALGTVADLVPLDGNNRILVEQGLKRIRAAACVPGISALLEAGRREQARASAADLGFAVGPRLNAAGRLDDMSLGIECLLADNLTNARETVARLDDLNRERREIETRMRDEALASLDETQALTGEAPGVGITLFDDHWHQGVVGLVASKVKDRWHRPVVACARAADGELKGSARSVRGMHIRDALEAIDTRHPGLIGRFGGHAMAAGLSLPEAHLERFREAFDQEARRWLSEDDLTGVLVTDGPLAPEHLSLELAELLRQGGPWGQAFPEPSFDGEFDLLQARTVGEAHLKLTLGLSGGAGQFDAIAFNRTADELPAGCRRVRAVYVPEVNEYRGVRGLQLRVEYLESL